MIDKKENGIVEGAQVLYVLPNGKVRPAVIVNAWSDDEDGKVNLIVFTDFANDELNPVEWRTSVPYSADKTPGTYSFADGREVKVTEAKEAEEESTSTETADAETTASEGAEKSDTEAAAEGDGEDKSEGEKEAA